MLGKVLLATNAAVAAILLYSWTQAHNIWMLAGAGIVLASLAGVLWFLK